MRNGFPAAAFGDNRMGDNDTAYSGSAQVILSWDEASRAVRNYLHPVFPLPASITDLDKDLVDLMTACGNARARLREKSGG